MQRSGTEAIKIQIKPSKPKRQIIKITSNRVVHVLMSVRVFSRDMTIDEAIPGAKREKSVTIAHIIGWQQSAANMPCRVTAIYRRLSPENLPKYC